MNCLVDKIYLQCSLQKTDLTTDEIDIEFEKVIKQLEFATWMKTLDELVEMEREIKKIEIDYLNNYHRQ
ncbi:Hypothetical protein PACV_134 [Pacmanvirus A23]|uniref:Hypothetical protein n=1 Tax=Pacmanvirus A23 TaxID=1932881 RepID=UPI000A0948C4|nr:Hypothetical protein B9W72_gp133 [Pacmanvirus A23]SIP85850.1 Hypothetical protein PACV_134 [Pacmanvirus A23]